MLRYLIILQMIMGLTSLSFMKRACESMSGVTSSLLPPSGRINTSAAVDVESSSGDDSSPKEGVRGAVGDSRGGGDTGNGGVTCHPKVLHIVKEKGC